MGIGIFLSEETDILIRLARPDGKLLGQADLIADSAQCDQKNSVRIGPMLRLSSYGCVRTFENIQWVKR